MAEDPKRNLQTQKGITDEIKAQREELSKLTIGSVEYNSKLKEVIRLENIKKTILEEQKTVQEKQNEIQDKAKSVAKELNGLIAARDKKLKSLRGQESFSANLQKQSQKAQSDFLKTLKTRINKSGELVATSKEQQEVIEAINSGQNDISGLQKELEISKAREKSLRGKNLIYKEDEQTLQKILESEIKD